MLPTMRILYVHQYFATLESATGTRSYEFARRLVERGHEVTMVTGRTWLGHLPRSGLVSRMDIDGIDVRVIGVEYSPHMGPLGRLWAFVAFMVAATWVCLRVRSDVVYASSTPLTVGVPGWLAARRWRVPFVFEIRDLWPEAPIQLGFLRSPLLRGIALWLEAFLYRRAAHVVALSPGMADGVTARGVPRERVSVIPNSSDTHLFAPGPKDPAVLERWGLSPDDFVVAYVGAMGASNDLGQVVEAARIVAEGAGSAGADAVPTRTVFVLAGDGAERLPLEALARDLGLEDIVWAGSLAKSDVPGLLSAADVALVTFAPVPILETNSPNKAFDALAAGRPLVVNFGGWIADLVRDEGVGRAAEPGDPASLARVLMELRDDPEGRARMGSAARRLAEERFDRAKLAGELAELLVRVAGGSGGGGSGGG